LTSIDDRVVRGNSVFAFGLFRKTCGNGETKNLFISPLSVSVALAMTYNGASGKTAGEMADVLGFKGIDLGELNQSMADLTTVLEQADSAVQLTVANSLWGRKGFDFRPDFLQRNAAFYRAQTTSLDFADPGTSSVINGWVNRSTRGLIDKIVDVIPRDAMLYLINAIYFKGRWQTAFDPASTINGPFHLAGGNEKIVPMMNQSGSFRYAEDNGVQVVRLPYGTGRMGMYIFLPVDVRGLGGFLGGLNDRVFIEWMSNLATREGDVLVPRFKIEYECGLVPTLRALGMRDAFDASTADFSGMSDADLCVSEVKHKAVVEVNEEGTKAAAVTSVEMKTTSVREPADRFSFIADQPFFFVIRDDATGTILFMGALYDPAF
jgi:serpin B